MSSIKGSEEEEGLTFEGVDGTRADPVEPLKPWVHYMLLGFHALGAAAHTVGIVLVCVDGRLGLKMATFRTLGNTVGDDALDTHRTSRLDQWVYPTQVTLAFFALSLGFHVVVAGALYWSLRIKRSNPDYVSYYDWAMHYGIAPWRWLEYGFSAALMLLIACMVLGARETHVVWCVVGSMAVCITFGWMTELHSSYLIVRYSEKKGALVCGYKLTRRWRPRSYRTRLQIHLLGYLPYAIAWGTIYDSYLFNVEQVRELVPSFVDYAVHSSFAAFTLFGFVQLFNQVFPWGPSVYWVCEATYVVLSFAAKANLGFVTLYQALAKGALFDQILGVEDGGR